MTTSDAYLEIAAGLSQPDLTTRPGIAVRTQLTIDNLSQLSVTCSVGISGIEPGWIRAPRRRPGRVKIGPGEQGSLEIALRPPQGASPGVNRFVIDITAAADPGPAGLVATAELTGSLTVTSGGWDVVISYAPQDTELAQRITAGLQESGRSVWIDEEQTRTREAFLTAIEVAIRESNALVIIIGEAGLSSHWMLPALNVAAESNKRIVPVLAPRGRTELIPSQLQAHQLLDFSDRSQFDRSLATLVQAIERVTERAGSNIVRPPEHDLSTHIATDIWTLDDSLGYRAYAHAIYRFITHPQTRPPLTISIQAPWGGGKTSLMRMIQHALDPGAANEVRHEARQPRGELTCKRALLEIESWISSKDRQKHEELPNKPAEDPTVGATDRVLRTVWFNAWKYESTNQVWSGLVDAIMQQVAARLSLIDREIFWLQLNMKRIDADKIRQRIYERILRYWWRGIRTWVLIGAALLVSSIFLAVTGWLTDQPALQNAGWIGGVVSAIASTGFVIAQFFRARAQVESEPAASSLADFLDAPNYREELGFVHHVEADLRRVLASVPQELRPIVVFIDDLDRCSPNRVAQVVEAVNLFLAGEFPDCIFVLGMDPEMVAASLQAAYKDMIEFLPADAGIPVGWRFMDKFVQLPFQIPPSEEGSVTRYTTSLLSVVRPKSSAPAEVVAQPDASLGDPQAPESVPRAIQPASGIEPDPETVRRRLDEGIRQFDEENPELRRILRQAAAAFRGNPRELKRFINAFRFQYYLWWARRAQELDVPSLDQLVRWTVLAIRWPEVVRWLWRDSRHEVPDLASRPDGEDAVSPARTRLEIIEDIGAQAVELSAWQLGVKGALDLTPQMTPWLADEDLFRFFHEEGAQHLPDDRLSAASGKGLW